MSFVEGVTQKDLLHLIESESVPCLPLEENISYSKDLRPDQDMLSYVRRSSQRGVLRYDAVGSNVSSADAGLSHFCQMRVSNAI
jgi:hypothetical protein